MSEVIPPGERDDAQGGRECLGAARDDTRKFALQGLGVDAAFTGYHEGSILQMLFKVQYVQDGVGTWSQFGTGDGP